MSYLVDTNVISELRKGKRADQSVRTWFSQADARELFLSVLVIGEVQNGIEHIRRRDSAQALALERWLQRITRHYNNRILPVTADVATTWGRLNVPDPLPVIDSLLAATAHVHGLTVATRNVADIARIGVPVINPFDPDGRVADQQ